MKISKMTNEQLIDEFISYDEIVNKIQCYGTKDLMMLDAITREIEKRGGEISHTAKIEFPEQEDDE